MSRHRGRHRWFPEHRADNQAVTAGPEANDGTGDNGEVAEDDIAGGERSRGRQADRQDFGGDKRHETVASTNITHENND